MAMIFAGLIIIALAFTEVGNIETSISSTIDDI